MRLAGSSSWAAQACEGNRQRGPEDLVRAVIVAVVGRQEHRYRSSPREGVPCSSQLGIR
jgi:hypothetical protein